MQHLVSTSLLPTYTVASLIQPTTITIKKQKQSTEAIRSTTHTTHIHTPQVERESRLQVSCLLYLQAVLRGTEKVAIYQQCMVRFKKESVWSR